MSNINTNVTIEQINAKLSEYDFVVVVDASGSMEEDVAPGNPVSRWDAVQETAMTFVRDVEKIDADGLGLVLFSGTGIVAQDNVTSKDIKNVFATKKPRGSTPLAQALTEAFKLAGKSDKKDFIVVFTDGVPDDKAAVARVIVEQSQKQATDDALTILFVQVGDDASAKAYLKSLDDDLKGAKFDIVDSRPQPEADAFNSTAELVYSAIND